MTPPRAPPCLLRASLLPVLLLLLLAHSGSCSPLHHIESESNKPAAGSPMALSELGSRVVARVSPHPDPRLPLPLGLPSAADVEAIKKVAQILVMLGEQVIPTIIGGQSSGGGGSGVAGAAVLAACDPQLLVDSPEDLIDN